jgi:hypothetical protein
MSGGAAGFRLLAGLVVGCMAFGCAGRGGASGAGATPEAPDEAPEQGAPAKQAFGDRCVAQPSKSRDGMAVACDGDAMVFIVPGTDWQIEPPPAPAVVVFASSGPLNLSVRVADESESQYGPHEHLEAIFRGVSAALAEKGHRVSSPRFEQTRLGAVVLWYDVDVAADGGEALRMVNAWNAVRGRDGRYLDYHVSFTALPDDPAWKPAGGGAGPRERIVDLAGAFFVRPAR